MGDVERMRQRGASRSAIWGDPVGAARTDEMVAAALEDYHRRTGDQRFLDAAQAMAEHGLALAGEGAPEPKSAGRPTEYPAWFKFQVWANVEAKRDLRPGARPGVSWACRQLERLGGFKWHRGGDDFWRVTTYGTIRSLYYDAKKEIDADQDSQIALAARGWRDEIVRLEAEHAAAKERGEEIAAETLLWPEIPAEYR